MIMRIKCFNNSPFVTGIVELYRVPHVQNLWGEFRRLMLEHLRNEIGERQAR
jgi:hypothetical protein